MTPRTYEDIYFSNSAANTECIVPASLKSNERGVIHPNVLCSYPYQNTQPKDLERKQELTEASCLHHKTEGRRS